MIYGSFLIIIFIMSFSWVETTHYVFFEVTNKYWLCIFYVVVIGLFVSINLEISDEFFYISVWQINFISYYEILAMDLDEELEFLGWGLGFDNIMILFLISIILSLVCVCMICIINIAKKSKLINHFIHYNCEWRYKYINKFIYLRVQNMYTQNFKKGYHLKRHQLTLL